MTTQNYEGGYHRGAVCFRYITDMNQIVTCNCSRCLKLGSALTFMSRDNFALSSGADMLVEYLFNKHVIRKQFCKVCGIESFAYGQMPDGMPMSAINANCLGDAVPREPKSHHQTDRAI